MVKKIVMLALLLSLVACAGAFADRVPPEKSGVENFYIFGPDGNPYYGAYTGEVTLYVEVPDTTTSDVTISVIDPNTGGKVDENYKDWNTETVFSVYGDSLLDTKTYGDGENDLETATFGPYAANKGMRVGNKYVFKLVVKTTKGDDANLFALDIQPSTAEAYGYTVPFRLSRYENAEMSLFPAIPSDTEYIIVRNYDLDPDGGTSYIYTTPTNRYKLNDSGSGVWAETEIITKNTAPERLTYRVFKKTQKHGNTMLSVLDDKGNQLPIYFKGGAIDSVTTQKETATSPKPKKRPVAEAKKHAPKEKKVAPAKKEKVCPRPAEVQETKKCDTFVFDATESYDPNKRPLSFLWEFGDGATSKDAVTTHTYKKEGEYDVTLTVVNDTVLGCNKDVESKKLKVNFPPEPVINAPDAVCAGREIVFDASETKVAEGETLTYMWNFGDGTTSQEAKTTHVYTKGGVYPVTLTVKDNSGTPCDTATVTRSVRVNTTPTAKIGDNITICETDQNKPFEVKFDASNSSDAENDVLTYTWDFGDGKTGNGPVVTHTYEKGGVYTVKLNVADKTGSDCGSASDSITVTLNRAPVALAGESLSICATDEVALNGSKSYDKDGDDLKYTWDFGDGTTGEGAKVTHKFEKGGKYTVTLTVDDGRGMSCSKATSTIKVTTNTAPYASLKAPTAACVKEQVTFDATGSNDADGDVLTYTWNFGDGKELKVGPLITHTFEKSGVYKVTVTVDDGKKSPCSKAIAQTEVKVNGAPCANAGPNKVCCVGEVAEFDGSKSTDPDGDKLSYTWDFGDGTTAEGAKVTHIYKTSGKYVITLTVNDGSGSKCGVSTAKFNADVSESPVSVIKVKPKNTK